MAEWKIFALGAAIFAGMTAVLAKVGVKDIPSNLATLVRTIVIILFITMIVTIRQEWQHEALMNKKSMLFLILSGFATGLSWLCYYRALQIGPVAMVASIDKLSLVFAIIFSVLFLGEKLTPIAFVGLGMIVTGTFLVAMR